MLQFLAWFSLFVVGIAFAIYKYLTRYHGYFKKLGIPGPEPGVLGLLPRYGKEPVTDIDLDLLKKYGKVFGYFHGPHRILSVSDPDMIKEICVKHFNQFGNRSFNFPVDKYEETFLTLAKYEKWRVNRQVLSPSFTTGKLRGIVPLMKLCTENFLKHLSKHADSGKSFDAKQFFNGYTMDVVCSSAFGVDIDSQDNPDNPVVKAAVKITKFDITDPFLMLCVVLPCVVPVFTALGSGFVEREAKNFLIKTIEKVIEEREKNPINRNDFIDMAMKGIEETKDKEDGQKFTKYDMIGNLLVFLLAAYDTTSTSLSFTSYCLATNPDIQDKVVQEINQQFGKDEEPNHDNLSKLTYLHQVFDESLRVYPPLLRINRLCGEDLEINGTFISKGTEISFPIYALHHNPEFWENPDVFDPERFSAENKESRHPYCYMPFGHGPRNCIGQRLAFLEAKSLLVSILRRYRFVCGPETETPNLKIAKGDLFLRAENGIHLRIEKR